jgi:NAD(P)-dependent dehydrogenase (short-subunit alcohol dehydrogenase family)
VLLLMSEIEKVQQSAESSGAKVWYFKLDATNSADVQRVFTAALSGTRFPLRGLVCCAGISGEGPSLTFSADQMRRIIDVNVMGTFLCAQAAAQHIQYQKEAASFVLIASMSAHVSNQGVDTVAYNSSKAAVAQMTRSLAAEWGGRADMPLIRVNSVSPGYIQTRMSAESMADPETKQLWTEGNMLCRLSEAHEYRGVVVFLLSDASSYMTGADVRVDGGHTAW